MHSGDLETTLSEKQEALEKMEHAVAQRHLDPPKVCASPPPPPRKAFTRITALAAYRLSSFRSSLLLLMLVLLLRCLKLHQLLEILPDRVCPPPGSPL